MNCSVKPQFYNPIWGCRYQVLSASIVVVKKTFRYSNVFFYNHLYRNSVFRNIIMESGINPEGLQLKAFLQSYKCLFCQLFTGKCKSLIAANKGVNRPECGGDGNAGPAFHALPIIVGQNGTGGKKRFKGRATRIIQGTKCVINFQAGLIN